MHISNVHQSLWLRTAQPQSCSQTVHRVQKPFHFIYVVHAWMWRHVIVHSSRSAHHFQRSFWTPQDPLNPNQGSTFTSGGRDGTGLAGLSISILVHWMKVQMLNARINMRACTSPYSNPCLESVPHFLFGEKGLLWAEGTSQRMSPWIAHTATMTWKACWIAICGLGAQSWSDIDLPPELSIPFLLSHGISFDRWMVTFILIQVELLPMSKVKTKFVHWLAARLANNTIDLLPNDYEGSIYTLFQLTWIG